MVEYAPEHDKNRNEICTLLKALFGSSSKQPFNQAIKKFHTIRGLEPGSIEYHSTIEQIVGLCQLAIRNNRFDGDAHVLLANVYFLSASAHMGDNDEEYVENLSRAAAVIHEWKTNGRMYSKERSNGAIIHQGILDHLNRDWPEWIQISVETDMRKLHASHYGNSIGIE